MNRGSELRKWDLHIHTPETAKNNQFGDPQIAWPKYIQTLEKSDISVFGITDYFSITNYLKVKDFKSKGRLENKEILPNVEMRIAPVTGNGKPINIHAIFDPTLTEDELNREFFREIKFEYKERTYSCIKEDLIELGRGFPQHDHHHDLEHGFAAHSGEFRRRLQRREVARRYGRADTPGGHRPVEAAAQARVPEPHRRDRDVRTAHAQGYREDRRHPVGYRAAHVGRERSGTELYAGGAGVDRRSGLRSDVRRTTRQADDPARSRQRPFEADSGGRGRPLAPDLDRRRRGQD